jgi:hypothetical protein
MFQNLVADLGPSYNSRRHAFFSIRGIEIRFPAKFGEVTEPLGRSGRTEGF